ncbi:hypothetical protein H1R20_g16364, partial [Candolleomyces eurysporus]
MNPKPARLPDVMAFPRNATTDDTLLPSHVYTLSFDVPSPSAEVSSEDEDGQLLLLEKNVDPVALNVNDPMDDLQPAFSSANYASIQGQWTPASPRQPDSYHLDPTGLGSSRMASRQSRVDKVGHEQPRVRWEETSSNPDRALRTSKQGCSMPTRGQARPKLSRGLSYTNASEDPLAQQTQFAASPIPTTRPASNPSSFSSGLSYQLTASGLLGLRDPHTRTTRLRRNMRRTKRTKNAHHHFQ